MSSIDIQYIQTVEYSIVGEAAKKKQSGPTLINTARPSLCPIDQPQQWHAACLLLSVPQAGDASAGRAAAAAPQHGAAAANTGSVTFTAAVAERRVVGAVMR